MSCANSPRQALTAILVWVDCPRQALTRFEDFESPRQALTPMSWDVDSPRQALTRMLSPDFIAAFVTPTAAGTLRTPSGFAQFSESPRQALTRLMHDSPRQALTEMTP